MATTTAKRAAAQPAPVPVHVPTVWELRLGDELSPLFGDLAGARQERLAGERKEKPLKEAVKAIYEPECDDLEQGDTLQLYVADELVGNVIRCPNSQPTIDLDLLMTAFPEAYEQCVTKGTHLRFNPA